MGLGSVLFTDKSLVERTITCIEKAINKYVGASINEKVDTKDLAQGLDCIKGLFFY